MGLTRWYQLTLLLPVRNARCFDAFMQRGAPGMKGNFRHGNRTGALRLATCLRVCFDGVADKAQPRAYPAYRPWYGPMFLILDRHDALR